MVSHQEPQAAVPIRHEPQALGNPARLAVDELNTAEGNPRRGRVDVIAESLRVTGQYRPIVVNKGTHTGRPMEVLAGNHTLLAARSLGWAEVDAWVVDVDDQSAKRIVVADNRTADAGDYDNAALADLLASLESLEGTGYSLEELDALYGLIDAPSLDELADKFGDPTDEDAWPRLSFKVPPEVERAWRDAVSARMGDEARTLAVLLGLQES